MSAPGPGPDDAGSGGAGPALPPGCRGILVLRALRLGALLAVVALLPVLTLTAGALVPTALLDPTTRTTAPADSELPARPAVPGGDGEGSKNIDWTYNVGTLLDVVAGTAGPIVLTPEGVTALNGEDGSVRWTYRRDASYVNGHGEQIDRYSPPYSENALTVSPDARHVAVRIKGPGIIVSVVLDSTTGEVTAEHRSTFRSPLQMTDSLASGEEAAPVPLGSASGMNTVASHASGTLVTATLLDRPAKNDVIDESTVSWAEAVLDPATGTATPASEYPGLAAARVGLRTTVVDTQATTSVVIEPAGGGPGVSAPVPPGTLIEPWKPADSRNDAENETENDAEPLGKASSNVIAMTVPGATTIVIRSKLSASDLPIVSLIYGMAGEDR